MGNVRSSLQHTHARRIGRGRIGDYQQKRRNGASMERTSCGRTKTVGKERNLSLEAMRRQIIGDGEPGLRPGDAVYDV